MALNILVTGGAGYIGSILTPLLVECGHNVTVLDNFLFKQSSLNHLCIYKNFEVINGDVRVLSTIKALVKNKDIIIPLAALVGAPLCNKDPIGAKTTNNEAIKLLLSNISKNQIILMPTTNSAYGSGGKNNFCDEESELNPISSYAQDKVEVEKKLIEHDNFISFRLATVFGMSPRMRLDLLVNDFTYRAVFDKSIVLFEEHFKRNYVHVRDVASVFLHAIDNYNAMKNNIYNVGLSTANLSKRELCEEIKKHIMDLEICSAKLGKDPDQRNYIVSNEKIEKTGFKTKFTLNDGINELIKGFKMIKRTEFGNI